ncbi:mechanosensitive ion channel family protein [Chitinimonas koreensis]|uniref:mechanosensitive ion channel family protein n=1 Tax=Chitinimonas koreensis TaxID=356302 RepID=UPI0004159226|nr:mechanosensitive ion channel domain-containing protein [Chitinimonas koreensis]QNM97260.1 mechanosensitive ion channel [Chitinimonas koreensis]
MTASMRPTPLYDFLDEFQQLGPTQPALLMQIAVLLGCGILAWLLSRALRPKLREAGSTHWRFSSEGIARVLFPLMFWLSVEVATVLWRTGHNIALLRLAASLLSAMVLARTVVYLLQEVFIQSEWVKRALLPVALLIWLLFALHITGVLPELQALLDGLAFNLGKQRVSVLTVINGLLSVMVTLLLAMWLGRLFEQRVMAAKTLDLSLRVVITKIVRTVLVVLGVMVALPLVGIDLTVLSVFGGALGVGLGFGLQKIASNYVSGFIILLDGSIRIGDLVSIDNRRGLITRITARYVVLKMGDGGEAIIPNEALITSTVLNLSHSDTLFRIPMPVQVAYGTDLEQAMALLVAATEGEPRILAEPPARAFVKGFGESGIDLELAFWIADASEGTLGLTSSLNLKIWKAFEAHGIEIPYPQRDLRIVSPADRPPLDGNQTSSAR